MADSRTYASLRGGGVAGGSVPSGELVPHTHELALASPYTDVETWERAGTTVFADNRMYQTGITIDTSKDFFFFTLIITGAGNPRELEYKRMRTVEWEALELDDTADDGVFNRSSERSGLFDFATNERYNVISVHLRRYVDGGENKLAIGVELPSDAPATGIRGIRYFYEHPVTETTGGEASSISGSSLLAGSFANATPPAEDTVGLIENIEGVLYEHDRRHHDGHGKMIGGTASPGTWITLSHDDFLGFFTHSRPPPDNEFTHGKFYYGRDYGSFLIHRVHGESGFTGVTGNFTYDPFDEGEPWHEVTIAGAEVDLNFRGGVDHLSVAFAAANAIGEVFANRGGNEIVYVSEFVAQSDGYDEFFRRIYLSPNAKNPIVEFWGQGQASADPVAPVARVITGGGAYYRYEWAQEKPNLVIGYDFGIKAVDAADVTGVDLIVAVGTTVAEAVLGDQRVFFIPAGQYQMKFNASHRADLRFNAWRVGCLCG